ncbi:hypothetical protein F2P81_010008 [Scophthalmus maximus]|uniref:Uncharacterized protein n=1 Tax=Scophthalmus maximus TaxID=52904 RepID=A0A6A4T1J6_SCOMX|nr:hypothetical protein F2P81_010008 [Scophthalmus maximus]
MTEWQSPWTEEEEPQEGCEGSFCFSVNFSLPTSRGPVVVGGPDLSPETLISREHKTIHEKIKHLSPPVDRTCRRLWTGPVADCGPDLSPTVDRTCRRRPGDAGMNPTSSSRLQLRSKFYKLPGVNR